MSVDSRLLMLKRSLHACAEIAGDEVRTANVIAAFLRVFEPSRMLYNLGGWGVAAIYEGHANDCTVLVRCELDALPTSDDQTEVAEREFAHLCGHDGHMTMVAGLAPGLVLEPPPCRVVLLFQPAEETGEGARLVIDDPRFDQIKPDYAIALHNLPGFPEGHVIWRDGTFASSSIGMHVALDGHPSHAAEPEKARSPMHCMCRLPSLLEQLVIPGESTPHRLVTITHLSLGERTFGITPGRGTLFATLRSEKRADLLMLMQEARATVAKCTAESGLEFVITWHDDFPETSSDTILVSLLRQCCAERSIPSVELDDPFRWSEDFGHFSDVCPSLFFGLGAGANAARLHQTDYQFPDSLIPIGMTIFGDLIRRVAREHRSVT